MLGPGDRELIQFRVFCKAGSQNARLGSGAHKPHGTFEGTQAQRFVKKMKQLLNTRRWLGRRKSHNVGSIYQLKQNRQKRPILTFWLRSSLVVNAHQTSYLFSSVAAWDLSTVRSGSRIPKLGTDLLNWRHVPPNRSMEASRNVNSLRASARPNPMLGTNQPSSSGNREAFEWRALIGCQMETTELLTKNNDNKTKLYLDDLVMATTALREFNAVKSIWWEIDEERPRS
ncbi:hypothetical protein BKA64DRAFT_726807 [Cadophora sp. MPI-SDFR-AT-0126]|nr:hypothetical protein BKA64DRAFT_726807 [Leotiomycetes sp. MPI-SDFR-AT-0126]